MSSITSSLNTGPSLSGSVPDGLTSWGNEGSSHSRSDPGGSAWSVQQESQSARKPSTATAPQSLQDQFSPDSPEFQRLSQLYTDRIYPKPNWNPIPAFEVISVHEGLGSISICVGKPPQVRHSPSARLGLFDKETGAVATLFAGRLVILNDEESKGMWTANLEVNGAKAKLFFGNPFGHKHDGTNGSLEAEWVGCLPPELPQEEL